MRTSFLSVIALVCSGAPAFAGDLVVHVDGVKEKGGTVMVALYGREPIFRDAVKTATAKAKAGRVDVIFKDVAAGDYVVSVLHDADDDRKIGMIAGKMTEGTAISNAAALRGAPSFAVNKVPVPSAGGAVTVSMSYPEDRAGW